MTNQNNIHLIREDKYHKDGTKVKYYLLECKLKRAVYNYAEKNEEELLNMIGKLNGDVETITESLIDSIIKLNDERLYQANQHFEGGVVNLIDYLYQLRKNNE